MSMDKQFWNTPITELMLPAALQESILRVGCRTYEDLAFLVYGPARWGDSLNGKRRGRDSGLDRDVVRRVLGLEEFQAIQVHLRDRGLDRGMHCLVQDMMRDGAWADRLIADTFPTVAGLQEEDRLAFRNCCEFILDMPDRFLPGLPDRLNHERARRLLFAHYVRRLSWASAFQSECVLDDKDRTAFLQTLLDAVTRILLWTAEDPSDWFGSQCLDVEQRESLAALEPTLFAPERLQTMYRSELDADRYRRTCLAVLAQWNRVRDRYTVPLPSVHPILQNGFRFGTYFFEMLVGLLDRDGGFADCLILYNTPIERLHLDSTDELVLVYAGIRTLGSLCRALFIQEPVLADMVESVLGADRLFRLRAYMGFLGIADMDLLMPAGGPDELRLEVTVLFDKALESYFSEVQEQNTPNLPVLCGSNLDPNQQAALDNITRSLTNCVQKVLHEDDIGSVGIRASVFLPFNWTTAGHFARSDADSVRLAAQDVLYDLGGALYTVLRRYNLRG